MHVLTTNKLRFAIYLAVLMETVMLPSFAVGQSHSYRFDRITVDDGLSSGDVWSIYQDKYGFMWFGTSNGLNRYDGRNIKVYQNSPDDSTSLFANKISAIAEDPTGNLWLLAGALHRYDRLMDRFVRYHGGLLSSVNVSLSFGPDFQCDKNGVLWIGTSKGLITFDPKLNLTRSIDLGPGNMFSVDLTFDHSGHLWISYMIPLMIIRLDTATLTYEVFRNDHGVDESRLPPAQNTGTFVDRANNVWLNTWGMATVDQNVRRPVYREAKKPDGTRVSTTAICQDSSGRLWTGSWRGGIRMYDPSTGISEFFKHSTSDANSPNSNFVRVAYTDRTGNVWFGTSEGVAKFATFGQPFVRYRNITNDEQSLLPGEVLALTEDHDKNLWIVNWGSGISVMDRSKSTIRRYDHRQIHNWVFDIYDDPEKGILVSSSGVNRYEHTTDRFKDYSLFSESGRIDLRNAIFDLRRDTFNTLWYATLGGVVRETENIRSWYGGDQSRGLPETQFSRIFALPNGSVWAETPSGALFRYDRDTDFFHRTAGTGSFVYDMHMDSSGTTWLGVKGGIACYDPVADSILGVVPLQSQGDDFVYGILEDDHSNLWLAASNGLYCYHLRSGSIRRFGPEDGYPIPTIGVNAKESYEPRCKLRSGELVFGLGNAGIVVFHPDSIKYNTRIPPVYVTRFTVTDRTTGEVRVWSQANITYLDELTLTHDQNDFALSFAALDYTSSRNNRYRYKLEGYHESWVEAGNQNSAVFTNIGPGEYVFRVKGSNNDGVWNEEGTSLKIIITPPWWKTWWAYSVYGFLFLGLLYAARRYELNRQTLKHQAELEHMEAKKLKELDQTKSRFFANISHEFRTPLTLIEGPAKRILSEEGSPKENAGLIVRNSSRLLQLVNQLLDLSRIEAGQLKLKVEHQNLCDLVKGIGAAFETMARKKVIRYKIEVPQREEYGWVDGDAVEKCITNLLSNAMKFTPEGGSVTLAMESDAERMTVRVTDSGIGIEEFNMQKVFDRFYQVDDKGTRQFEGTGIGLALTKDLVELHQGTIGIESTPGVGSTFTMSIPVNKESYTPEQLFEPVTDKTAEPKARKEDIEALDVEDVRSGEDARYGNDEQDGQELPLILLIEDNEDMRKYIRMHLNGSYKIVEASDGVEGLGKALETVPDLIISDQMMPKMEGSVLVHKVKSDQRISHIPVILLTAKAEKKDKLEGLGVGADDYLVKPFDATELKARMDNLILQRRKLWDKFRTEWMTKPRETHAVSSDEKFLAQVMGIIEKNMSDPDFDISRLSEATALSRMQLHRKVKTMTGCSPGELLRNVRLEKASEMIRKNTGTITQIAFDVGFNNLSYFAKAFREKFGMNPSDF